MARTASSFKRGDVARALRAARDAGVDIARVEIDPATGKIVIVANTAGAGGERRTELDQWLETHAR